MINVEINEILEQWYVCIDSIKKYVCKVLDPYSILTVTSSSSFANTLTHKNYFASENLIRKNPDRIKIKKTL